MSLLFTSLCGVLGGGTYAAESSTRAGMERHRVFLTAGNRDSVTRWANTDPSRGQDTPQGSVQLTWHSSTTVTTTHSCVPPPVQALQQLQGPGEHSPTSTEVGKEEMAPSRVPELLPKQVPASVPGRGLWLAHHAAAPTGTIHPPSRSGVPCHLGCSTCAHVPKHEGWHVLWKQPRPLPSPPSRAMRSTRYGRQMRV